MYNFTFGPDFLYFAKGNLYVISTVTFSTLLHILTKLNRPHLQNLLCCINITELR